MNSDPALIGTMQTPPGWVGRNMLMKTKQGAREQNAFRIRAHVGNKTDRCHFFQAPEYLMTVTCTDSENHICSPFYLKHSPNGIKVSSCDKHSKPNARARLSWLEHLATQLDFQSRLYPEPRMRETKITQWLWLSPQTGRSWLALSATEISGWETLAPCPKVTASFAFTSHLKMCSFF